MAAPAAESLTTTSPAATRRHAARLGALVQGGDIIALLGPLGAGKTCFAQGFARGLGVPPQAPILSPSFNLVLEHGGGRLPLYHLDLYRLVEAAELDEIGFDHYLSAGGVCLIEWLDRFPLRAPPERLEVGIEIRGPRRRRLAIRGFGVRGEALAAAWLATAEG